MHIGKTCYASVVRISSDRDLIALIFVNADGFEWSSFESERQFTRNRIVDIHAAHSLQCVAYDPWNSLPLVMDVRNVLPKLVIKECRQGYSSLSAPTKRLSDLLHAGLFNYYNDREDRFIETAFESDMAGNIKPAREAHLFRAMAMALSNVPSGMEIY